MSNSWFETDREGLRKLALRKGIEFILFELYQNAADENITAVELNFVHEGGRNFILECIDDNPDGFKDIRHAYTLFANSVKKIDPSKRGRYNIGEKLVLACCKSAWIKTTTGCVFFKEDGTRYTGRDKTESGSHFRGYISSLITVAEHEEACRQMMRIIPEKGIKILFNGRVLQEVEPIKSFKMILPTHIADEEGMLRVRERETVVDVYEAMGDARPAAIYELGIPVVETGDKWIYDVRQKVPVNLDRDNVSPHYLRRLRTAVFNAMQDAITVEDVNASFVKDATESPNADPEAIRKWADLKFGEKRVSFDPSDQEANKLAVVKGYQIVHGASLSSNQWTNIRKANAIAPAGQVTPSPKPFSPGGRALKLAKVGEVEAKFEAYIRMVARFVIHKDIDVVWVDDRDWGFAGAYGRSTLHVNIPKFGRDMFKLTNGVPIEVDDFLIHELAHEYESDHLSEGYYRALTLIGARLKDAVIRNRQAFEAFYP